MKFYNSSYSRFLCGLILVFLLNGCEERPDYYNGYIDTDLIYASSDFGGKIEKLYVRKGQTIQKSQLLFRLEKDNQNYALKASEGNTQNLLDEKQAIFSQLEYAKKNYHRLYRLYYKNSASKDELDIAQQNFSVLQSQYAAINAQISSSQFTVKDKAWQLNTRNVYTVEEGVVFDVYYRPGEYVQSGQPVLSIMNQNNIRVTFFIPEVDLSRVALNQKIHILFDGKQQAKIGYINYIAKEAEYAPPIIFSQEEKARLVFKVEAMVDKANWDTIHLGQPVRIKLGSHE